MNNEHAKELRRLLERIAMRSNGTAPGDTFEDLRRDHRHIRADAIRALGILDQSIPKETT